MHFLPRTESAPGPALRREQGSKRAAPEALHVPRKASEGSPRPWRSRHLGRSEPDQVHGEEERPQVDPRQTTDYKEPGIRSVYGFSRTGITGYQL